MVVFGMPPVLVLLLLVPMLCTGIVCFSRLYCTNIFGTDEVGRLSCTNIFGTDEVGAASFLGTLTLQYASSFVECLNRHFYYDDMAFYWYVRPDVYHYVFVLVV